MTSNNFKLKIIERICISVKDFLKADSKNRQHNKLVNRVSDLPYDIFTASTHPSGSMIARQETRLPHTVIWGRPVLLRMFKVTHFVLSTTKYRNITGIALYTE